MPLELYRAGSLGLPWICNMRQRQAEPGRNSSMANLLRLSLATLTFLVFFYSTILLTSNFYPLDWAPIAF